MREILFRGKTLVSKVWAVGYYEKGFEGLAEVTHFIVSKTDWKGYQVDPETIGQYTGFMDKNGVKIFEGDIVEFRDKKLSGYFVGVVKFGEYNRTELPHQKDRQYGFFIEFGKGQYLRRDITFWTDAGIEVIGNIYDNPELLENTTNE